MKLIFSKMELEELCGKDLSEYLVLIYNGYIYKRESLDTDEWEIIDYEAQTYLETYCFNYAFNLCNCKCLVVYSDKEDMIAYENVYDESEKLEDIVL